MTGHNSKMPNLKLRTGLRATILLANRDFHILIVTYSDCVIIIITLGILHLAADDLSLIGRFFLFNYLHSITSAFLLG